MPSPKDAVSSLSLLVSKRLQQSIVFGEETRREEKSICNYISHYISRKQAQSVSVRETKINQLKLQL